MKNRVTEILNIRYPIIQAPMYFLTNATFVAAVSNAGGLGIIGPNAGQDTLPDSRFMALERMREQIRKTKQLTDKPFGATLINGPDMSFWRPTAEMFVEEKVDVVLVNEVLDAEIFDFLKQHRIKILYRALTPDVANSQQAEKLGADIIVATGFDEGGTVPSRIIGTFSIVPMIADSVKIPVLAAGGIGDVRGVRAAMALGAEGVWIGSLFLTAQENPADEKVKQLIVSSSAEDLLLFRTLPAYYRTLPTPLSPRLAELDAHGADRETLFTAMNGYHSLWQAMRLGNLDKGVVSTGTGISMIKSVRTVAAIVADLAQDFITQPEKQKSDDTVLSL
ncbi:MULTISPECIES: NAD(P)H-dependent flavin oxidoreductase [Pantoea]|jgi:enoyl-[acyl-carrier protein] reductase II|uniref:NAD(P)H-dependent flavin oxidoreductase n=1 Tax=Pantoea TaxID=53335 RepID=UPI00068980E8|nr:MULTISPECIES: nitronate monooxygenase [Pantoea]KOA69936.1 diguanylate cyclase [Pantoea sp. CFSAN033090]MBD8118197.1 nitronate monooxygenase [Pantoea agglomerans]MBD8197957.1 nitronate monooxygenase [Pantoea agglomerans]MDN4621497.1 nitronate monooxygenase [Pantoea agglomerans]MVT80986.1 nitronate monooxygenase [Pantoea agglomerans]